MNGIMIVVRIYSIRCVYIVLSYIQYAVLKYIHTSCVYIHQAGICVCKCIKIFIFIFFVVVHWGMFVGAVRFYSYFHIWKTYIHIFLFLSYLEKSDPNIYWEKLHPVCPAAREGKI
jgi:hypothetical protein